MTRCFGDGDPLYERYHDEEWGVPVTGEDELFERVSLEAFQSGLAWITILRKRDAFRAAFAGFDPAVVAMFDATDVERLMGDASIVRNRAKIEATIANARAIESLHASGGSLREILWSDASAKDTAKALKSLGFRFVGPTTVESARQAVGVINGHADTCPGWARIEASGGPGRI
ncbi:MAG: DNA-3-methyladenine glycosylase [Actinomycetota bacterium]|nr:DNA-3-methyladenine glycosylase [Actinomycetota bacterium]